MAVSLTSTADDNELNVYNSDSVEYFELVSYIFIICCAVYAISAFVLGRRVAKSISFDGKLSRGACAGLGVALLALAVFNLVREFTEKGNGSHSTNNMYVLFETADGNASKPSYLFIAFTLMLIGSAAFFLYSAFTKSKLEGNTYAIASAVPSVALVVKIIYDFLLQSTNGYGSLYNYHLLGLSFVMLFAINETRFHFKKGVPSSCKSF